MIYLIKGKKENQDIDNIQKDQKKNALEKITTLNIH